MKVQQLSIKLKEYLLSQVDNMSKNNPVISFSKPLIKRVIDNKFDEADKMISLIADKNGEVDIEGIVDEMILSLENTNPFTIKNSFLGDVELGGGLIKMNIPFTSKRLVFNQDDIKLLKEFILNNK